MTYYAKEEPLRGRGQAPSGIFSFFFKPSIRELRTSLIVGVDNRDKQKMWDFHNFFETILPKNWVGVVLWVSIF